MWRGATPARRTSGQVDSASVGCANELGRLGEHALTVSLELLAARARTDQHAVAAGALRFL
jgi:hypothetical protein